MNTTLYIAVFACASCGWLLYFGSRSDHLKPATLWTVFGAGLVSGPPAGIASGFVRDFALGPAATAFNASGALAFFDPASFLLFF